MFTTTGGHVIIKVVEEQDIGQAPRYNWGVSVVGF